MLVVKWQQVLSNSLNETLLKTSVRKVVIDIKGNILTSIVKDLLYTKKNLFIKDQEWHFYFKSQERQPTIELSEFSVMFMLP